jgi:hypothetical protein
MPLDHQAAPCIFLRYGTIGKSSTGSERWGDKPRTTQFDKIRRTCRCTNCSSRNLMQHGSRGRADSGYRADCGGCQQAGCPHNRQSGGSRPLESNAASADRSNRAFHKAQVVRELHARGRGVRNPCKFVCTFFLSKIPVHPARYTPGISRHSMTHA